ncbi:NYN domain-containing protein [Falsigemmobacter faecalis]|uniref:NYN domain-containing protein n=1 Tax=Falsigemmobacter faecalis TaxID=2488730 RepID=A0A3P3DU80_9RHOB|nr:NYN domain-containing protein [Falsigemmobacter faecalis]RRH77306.1 NYN domain-containing protein [Falsigemmobacter faecalis]
MIQKICVMTDGDNISAKYAADILKAANTEGQLIACRVYTDATKANGWASTPGYRLVHSGAGKNAADILMALDAVDLCLTKNVMTFLIASSDGDFTHLATRLREYGAKVVGIGEAKAPAVYRAACSKFLEMKPIAPAVTVTAPPQAPKPKKVAATPQLSLLDSQIHRLIQESPQGPGEMTYGAFCGLMRATYDITPKDLSETDWRSYLQSRPKLYFVSPKGAEAVVRLTSKPLPNAAHSAG